MHEFDTVYREFHEDIFRFLLRLTLLNADLAEELTQETFYEAYLAIGTFKGQCHIKTWLCQIARNRFYLYLRKNRREVSPDPQASTPGFEADYETRRMVRDTLAAIQALEEPNRDVVLYRLFFDLSYAQIARLLDISENSARVIFWRSKKEIQKRMREEYPNEV